MGKRELARGPSGEQGRKKNKKIWVISGTAAAVLLGGYLGLCAWVNGTDRILPNVSVAGLDVSGMTVEEAQTALDRDMYMALETYRAYGISTEGMIHHSDRGVQYASKQYTNLLLSQG